ncbi:DUF2304 domain-containing protein [Actinotalea sp. Marseille-Q4924]|uniref:DUF2304 domain-containing protein n=1 Tax=Actinotalea sp. Marseille-Q4924 TaxID=2866571 RepID=UPI001CE43CE0|nr:DUF2304 domain-containing protein [Actinotalea sp. Marseille-Q4924]
MIKIVLLIGIGLVGLLSLRIPRGSRHQALRRVALLGFIAFAAASVLFPDVWNALARIVGVGRGTDLLLYVLIIAFLGYMATSYLRFREMESQVTQLARRIALDEAGWKVEGVRPAVSPGDAAARDE